MTELRSSDRIFTVSNFISMFRLALTVPLVIVMERGDIRWTIIIVAVALISDFLDGYLARVNNQITNLGKLLDPIADTFLMMAVMIFLIFDPVRQFPVFFLILLGIRDISISIIATYLMDRNNEIFETNLTGKYFVGISAFAMTLYIFKFMTIGFWVLMIATVLLFASWYFYLRKYIQYLHNPPAA